MPIINICMPLYLRKGTVIVLSTEGYCDSTFDCILTMATTVCTSVTYHRSCRVCIRVSPILHCPTQLHGEDVAYPPLTHKIVKHRGYRPPWLEEKHKGWHSTHSQQNSSHQYLRGVGWSYVTLKRHNTCSTLQSRHACTCLHFTAASMPEKKTSQHANPVKLGFLFSPSFFHLIYRQSQECLHMQLVTRQGWNITSIVDTWCITEVSVTQRD